MRKKHIPAHLKKKPKISRKKVIISTVAVVLSLCALTVGMLVAKYLNEGSSTGLVRAKNFYFTSNFLDGKEHTLAPGSTSVTFTLGNHEDDLRYSEVDIKYEYTVTDVDTGGTVTSGTGMLTNGKISDAEVTVSDLEGGKTYTVTAVGSGGYKKTLTATITVPEKSAQIYYNKDDSAGEYTLLTVWNEGDKSGNVTIAYTGIPDNTNPNMNGWLTNSSKAVTVNPHESKVFRFFDADATAINVTGADAKELY